MGGGGGGRLAWTDMTFWYPLSVRASRFFREEKTPRTLHTLRVGGGSARYDRSHAVRTYIPQARRVLIFLL